MDLLGHLWRHLFLCLLLTLVLLCRQVEGKRVVQNREKRSVPGDEWGSSFQDFGYNRQGAYGTQFDKRFDQRFMDRPSRRDYNIWLKRLGKRANRPFRPSKDFDSVWLKRLGKRNPIF